MSTKDIELKSNPKYCKNKQACCKTMLNPNCKAISKVNNELIFIENINEMICHYKMSFGHSYMCMCPRRIELLSIHKQ